MWIKVMSETARPCDESFSLGYDVRMTSQNANPNPLDDLVSHVVQSYHTDQRTQHLDSPFLPSRARTIEIIELLRKVMFPGFFDETKITSETVARLTLELLEKTREVLYEQIRETLRYEYGQINGREQADDCDDCDEQAQQITMQFLERIPALRRLLSLDVLATFDGDPAAANTDETIFCYPGLDAIFVYRMAHELSTLKVPLLPRIMTEYAHNETGIDIHPGAQIDESFFIDHGTGVVIGETCEIGKRVKIYQGVTLGAKSTKGGQAWRGRKRHPTVEDDVTIYGGAIILGGETIIGKGSTIGGSVFLTHSVPANHTVSMSSPQLKMKEKGSRKKREQRNDDSSKHDWSI